MTSRIYRVGIIGCGWVSTGHMNGYNAAQVTQVVAAADPDAERLEKFSQEYGIHSLYTDYAEMLTKEHLDIVSVCTWPPLHCQVTVDAASQDIKGILCEKPMALSLSDASKMVEACDRSHCKLVVAHQRRLEGRYAKAKQLLDSGEVGKLLKTEVYQGDLFTDDHGIDLVRFYAGDVPVRWIIGQVDWCRRYYLYGHNVVDSAIAHIKFENDVEGYVISGNAIEGHINYSMVLTGTDGVIEISGGNYPAESWVRLMNDQTSGWRRFDVENELIGVPRQEILGRPTIEYYWIKPWQLLVEALLDSIENNKESSLSGLEAMKTLEIIAAIYESSRLRTRVHFPLSPDADQPLELMERTHSAEPANGGKGPGS